MRIWLDTMIVKDIVDPKDTLTRLTNGGHIIVTSNTALDVNIFQENLMWFEEQLCRGKIFIEIWNTPDEMVTKPFYWSSLMTETPTSTSLRDAVSSFKTSAAEIIEIAKLIELYGIKKGDWKMGPWAPPEKLTKVAATELGISEDTSNRSEILKVAKRTDKMDVFNTYNCSYNRGLASQHCCDAILEVDGSYYRPVKIRIY